MPLHAYPQGLDAIEAGVLATKTPTKNVCPYEEEGIGRLHYLDLLNIAYNIQAEANLHRPQDIAKVLVRLTIKPQVALKASPFKGDLKVPVYIPGQILANYGPSPSHVQDGLQDNVINSITVIYLSFLVATKHFLLTTDGESYAGTCMFMAFHQSLPSPTNGSYQ